MKVYELIKELERFDGELEVICDTQDGAVYDIHRIEKEEWVDKDDNPVFLVKIS